MKIYSGIVSSLILLTLAGCRSETTVDGREIACTTELVAGIQVTVFERETGLPISCDASVTVIDGSFEETVTKDNNDTCENTTPISLAFERPGTYNVRVTKSGFADWQQMDVAVTANVCHVNTVSLQAYLDR